MAPSYKRLQQYAIAISVASIIYNGAEGALSIGLGAESSSRSLIFFGIQSGIEVASAAIVLWRFRRVSKPGEEQSTVISDADLRVEKLGTWGIGILIGLLALAAEGSAIAGLVLHTEPDTSNASLIISASALVIMILIWLPKRWLARELNSSTMAGEATCSLSCIQITIVLFAGSLIFRVWHGGWWVDNATTIMLGLLFFREAWKMLAWVRDPNFNGGCCGDCAHPPRLERDATLELGQQYKDLCDCCLEKQECQDGEDSCKCSLPVAEPDACCVPVKDDGAKCCTREIKQGVRPNTVPSTTITSGSHQTKTDAGEDNCKRGCCDSKPAASVPVATLLDDCCKDDEATTADMGKPVSNAVIEPNVIAAANLQASKGCSCCK